MNILKTVKAAFGISGTARLETMKENDAKEYQWRSTLDGRTCETCASLSNKVFTIGEGPLPPIHPNCRCQIIEVLGPEWDFLAEGQEQSSTFGPVDANLSYYEWVKTQNEAWQDWAIGATLGKLLRDGGLSADEFAALRVEKKLQSPNFAGNGMRESCRIQEGEHNI